MSHVAVVEVKLGVTVSDKAKSDMYEQAESQQTQKQGY